MEGEEVEEGEEENKEEDMGGGQDEGAKFPTRVRGLKDTSMEEYAAAVAHTMQGMYGSSDMHYCSIDLVRMISGMLDYKCQKSGRRGLYPQLGGEPLHKFYLHQVYNLSNTKKKIQPTLL